MFKTFCCILHIFWRFRTYFQCTKQHPSYWLSFDMSWKGIISRYASSHVTYGLTLLWFHLTLGDRLPSVLGPWDNPNIQEQKQCNNRTLFWTILSSETADFNNDKW